VINGFRETGIRGAEFCLPAPPTMGAPELAAEMAEVFALSLLRRHRLADLSDPHCRIAVDATTRFSLHELLCELRSLAWFDAEAPMRKVPADRVCDAELGQAEDRRALRWNRHKQLTLRTIFRSGVRLREGTATLSSLWQAEMETAPSGPLMARPGADAPMSQWRRWCAQHGSLNPRREGLSTSSATLEAMALTMHDTPPGYHFYMTALKALAHGTAWDKDLEAADPLWCGNRLMSVLAEAENRAIEAILRLAGRPDRLARPAVTAARMTVWLANEERSLGEATYREAAEELSRSAPNLLQWVSRENARLRKTARYETNLFLPLVPADQTAFPAGDCAAHVAVAAAMATVMKAVFDTSDHSSLRPVGAADQDIVLADALDRMVSNVAMVRVASGSVYPAENHQQIRLGQAIALQVLREAMEADNRSVALSLRDFDRKSLKVICNQRFCGRGYVQLREGARQVAWPQEGASHAPHLAVV
jgi:hypothetical protein